MWCGERFRNHGELIPVPSGKAYRISSPPRNGIVTRELAKELQRVLERFAREAGFSERLPIDLEFRPGVVGHHKVGRAADIYGVGTRGLEKWHARWDRALDEALRRQNRKEGKSIMDRERRENLGWRLYKALQIHGRWSQPCGYPVQLFGPWTRSEGPWTLISSGLLRAHRDHIHVAK
jgi:hypothetical protein